MLKYIAAFILIGTGGVAQEATPFYSYQECATMQSLAQQTASYGETVLFTGGIIQTHASGQMVGGQMIFTVNQDSGTWTLIHVFNNSISCMVANGNNFEPYTK